MIVYRNKIKSALCLLLLLCVTASAFAGCGQNEVQSSTYVYDDIEYTGEVQSDNFALLYNTLGYEQGGTKKAFVRSLQYVAPEKIGSNSLWTLMDTENQPIAQGPLEYKGLSFGLQLWEADFSDITQLGTYRLVAEITDGSYAPVYQEASSQFLIQNRIYSHNIILPLSLYNAQAREAPAELGGGYYDCNTAMGEAYSHGVFLNGLVQTYISQLATLTAEERTGLENAASIAFDYLVLLHDDTSGEFIHSDPRRYNADINQGFHNTYEALYGFCTYLYYFSDIDPLRAGEENYKRACQTVEYLKNYYGDDLAVQNGYPYKEFLIPPLYYLYKYSGDKKLLKQAKELIEAELESFDFRTMNRRGARSIPMFEGIYLFLTDGMELPEREQWIDKLTEIKDTWFKDLDRKNAMCIFPISDEVVTKLEWDEMWRTPVGEYSGKNWQLTTARAANAMDACFLGELTGDASMEQIAAGSIGYVLGLNAGFSGELVENPSSDRPVSAGAFVQNLNGRRVRGWSYWGFTPKNDQWMSVMNGYCMFDGQYCFKDETNDDWIYGETFLRHDGAFVYALCVYERFVNSLKLA